MMRRTLVRFTLLLVAVSAVASSEETDEPQVYWPIQGYETNDHIHADVYTAYLNGCLQAHSEDACIQAERRRISQNHRLPALQRNRRHRGWVVRSVLARHAVYRSARLRSVWGFPAR